MLNSNLAETSESNKNRAKTATTLHRGRDRDRHQASTNEWSSLSKGYDWNQLTIGRTPPRMRRSLTVMDNYLDDDENEWQNVGDSGSTDNINIDSINSFFDIKRASTRKQLTKQQQQQQQLQQQNLNQRPDTAFPKSRGLVPK